VGEYPKGTKFSKIFNSPGEDEGLSIKIITDNCCDLPAEELNQYDIRVVPLQVRFGDEELPLSGFDNQAFYEKVKASSILPSTNQPSPGDFLEEYKKCAANHQKIISIHFSSALSGTVQAASIAARMLENDQVIVFDSLKASVGQGLMVLEAARMASAGADSEDILKRLTEMRHTMRCVFVVGNLDALIKGGRLTRTKALIANTLDIKPVLHIDALGRIEPFKKAKGHKGARNKLLEIMGSEAKDLPEQTVGISHSDCREDAEYLRQSIIEQFGVKELVVGEIGPVIGSHVGAGTFAVYYEAMK
jgi:DegV family protein with EDD domain